MSVSEELKEACKEFDVSDDQLKEVMKIFRDNVDRGLSKSGHDSAIVKCFVTYVQDLPKGTETGKYVAVDVGGTNMRILLAELKGGKCTTQQKEYVLPDSIFTCTATEFFDALVDKLAQGLAAFGVANDNLPLGFTFSFPLMQKGLKVGILERWTKRFNIDGVVGTDVVKHFTDAIDRRNDVKVNVVAVVNDTTGTLVSCAFDNPDCAVGLIIGTGTNACYVEKQSVAELFDEPDHGTGNVIINTEWGAFGDDGALDFIRNEYDTECDKISINPGKQLHEKMISGLYLGDIVRLALRKYAKAGLILTKKCICPLGREGTLQTPFLTTIEEEPDGKNTEVRKIFKEMGIPQMTDDDAAGIKYVAHCASARAAKLVAAGLSTLINKMQQTPVIVGIDGSLYTNHPTFPKVMQEKMMELVDSGLKFELKIASDGSGRGAALVAAGYIGAGGSGA